MFLNYHPSFLQWAVPSPAGSSQPTELSIPDKWALSGTALDGKPEPKADGDATETKSAVAATGSDVAARRSAPCSTINLDGSLTDDRHSVITGIWTVSSNSLQLNLYSLSSTAQGLRACNLLIRSLILS